MRKTKPAPEARLSPCLSSGRGARSLPEGRRRAPRERKRARDQARGRGFRPRRSLRDQAAERVKAESLTSPPRNILLAAREVSQRGGGARRGSESARGTRRAVEPLWASREPVRRRAQVPSKRERRGASRKPVRSRSRVSESDVSGAHALSRRQRGGTHTTAHQRPTRARARASVAWSRTAVRRGGSGRRLH
jgi:hypothetical protein